jgi:hypothetical protein
MSAPDEGEVQETGVRICLAPRDEVCPDHVPGRIQYKEESGAKDGVRACDDSLEHAAPRLPELNVHHRVGATPVDNTIQHAVERQGYVEVLLTGSRIKWAAALATGVTAEERIDRLGFIVLLK